MLQFCSSLALKTVWPHLTPPALGRFLEEEAVILLPAKEVHEEEDRAWFETVRDRMGCVPDLRIWFPVQLSDRRPDYYPRPGRPPVAEEADSPQPAPQRPACHGQEQPTWYLAELKVIGAGSSRYPRLGGGGLWGGLKRTILQTSLVAIMFEKIWMLVISMGRINRTDGYSNLLKKQWTF